MAICAVEEGSITKPRKSAFGAVRAFFLKLSPRTAKLDLEIMPDRVKRDLGFLDGRDPRYEDERLR